MKKKIFGIILSIATVMLSCAPVVAAEDTLITFEGDSQKFITQEGTNEGFEDMQPGETRSVSVRLKNDNSDTMDFFMSAEILDNIAEKGNKDAVYDFSISKDNETFFASVIGATGNTIGEEYLTDDNNIKLATLAKGEESLVTVSLTLDGDSTENAYMNQAGQIKLRFSAGTPVENLGETQTIIQRVINYVKTGDSAQFVLLGGLLVVSAIGVIVFMKKTKKKEGN